MDGQRLRAVGPIQHLGGGQQGESGLHRRDGMRVHVGSLEDRHKAVSRGLIDIAASLVNTVQEGRKIAFDQPIQDLQRQLLAQARIATDIDKQDRDVALVIWPVPVLQDWR